MTQFERPAALARVMRRPLPDLEKCILHDAACLVCFLEHFIDDCSDYPTRTNAQFLQCCLISVFNRSINSSSETLADDAIG